MSRLARPAQSVSENNKNCCVLSIRLTRADPTLVFFSRPISSRCYTNFCACRSIRIGGQSTALLRAALAWAARGSISDGGSGEGESDTVAAAAAGAMYGDFRAAKEGAEEVSTPPRGEAGGYTPNGG